MGYVGLPLGAVVAQAGFPVCGFDIDPVTVAALNQGRSALTALVTAGTFRASADFAELGACDVVIICVPPPSPDTASPS